MRLLILCLILAAAWLAPGCASSPCDAASGRCIDIEPGPDVQERAQRALVDARFGDVVTFLAGTHEFDAPLELGVDGVTLRGEGPDRTTLSFAATSMFARALVVRASDTTIEALTIRDTKADSIRIEDSERVTIRDVRAERSERPSVSGAAIEFLRCTDALIEDSEVVGSQVEGIYVRESENVIVRRNRVSENTVGVSVENSSAVDVHGNTVERNTTGVFVYNLPGESQQGARVRVFDNAIADNNEPNRAPAGNDANSLSVGTGVLILAGHDIELFGNDIRDHGMVNLGAVSYQFLVDAGFLSPWSDLTYDPYTDTIYAHGNTFGPGGASRSGLINVIVQPALTKLGLDQTPSIGFDGYVNPAYATAADPDRFLDAYNLCFQDNDFSGNGDAEDFLNVDARHDNAAPSLGLAPHDCAHARLDPVSIPELGVDPVEQVTTTRRLGTGRE